MMTTQATYARGEDHHNARYTEEQVARAKRMLIEAERQTRFAPGELDRISRETGLSRAALKAVMQGDRWAWLPPAPPTTPSVRRTHARGASDDLSYPKGLHAAQMRRR